ncbi:hypothetical protein ACRRTK_021891 [Alexandromys fortis]
MESRLSEIALVIAVIKIHREDKKPASRAPLLFFAGRQPSRDCVETVLLSCLKWSLQKASAHTHDPPLSRTCRVVTRDHSWNKNTARDANFQTLMAVDQILHSSVRGIDAKSIKTQNTAPGFKSEMEQQAEPSVRLLCHRRTRLHLMEDSMDMDMSPLRPQNYLFGCELKADKDYHFKVDNDENEHQLSLRTNHSINVLCANCSKGIVDSSQGSKEMKEDEEAKEEEEEKKVQFGQAMALCSLLNIFLLFAAVPSPRGLDLHGPLFRAHSMDLNNGTCSANGLQNLSYTATYGHYGAVLTEDHFWNCVDSQAAVLTRLVGSQSWLWYEIGKDKAHYFLTIVQPLITSSTRELIWLLNSSEVKEFISFPRLCVRQSRGMPTAASQNMPQYGLRIFLVFHSESGIIYRRKQKRRTLFIMSD